jgi:hypothetical protein
MFHIQNLSNPRNTRFEQPCVRMNEQSQSKIVHSNVRNMGNPDDTPSLDSVHC